MAADQALRMGEEMMGKQQESTPHSDKNHELGGEIFQGLYDVLLYYGPQADLPVVLTALTKTLYLVAKVHGVSHETICNGMFRAFQMMDKEVDEALETKQ